MTYERRIEGAGDWLKAAAGRQGGSNIVFGRVDGAEAHPPIRMLVDSLTCATFSLDGTRVQVPGCDVHLLSLDG